MKSFVRSINLDTIQDLDIDKMNAGGNGRLNKYLAEYKIGKDLPLNMRYSFYAMYYYRHMVLLGYSDRV